MKEQWQNEGVTLTPADVKKFAQEGEKYPFLFEIEGCTNPLEGRILACLNDGEIVKVQIGVATHWFHRSQMTVISLIPSPASNPETTEEKETESEKRFSKSYGRLT